MATFKGTGFRGYRVYLEETLGQEAYQDFVETKLPADLRQIFVQPKILPSSSYPIEQQHRFLEICRSYWGPEIQRHMVGMGHATARTDLGGIYRFLIKLASPERTLEVLTSVWKNYFSDGSARLIARDPKAYVAEIEDAFHHPLHFHIVAGYVEEAITLAGAKGANVTPRPGTGPTLVEFLIRWN